MHINIQDGTSTIEFGGDLVLDFSGFRTTPLNTTVTIVPDYDAIGKELVKSSGFVTSINGISPTDRGEFFIAGSECDSWDYGEQGQILLTDLCPACTTCESIYRLKYETENLRQWINTLRDVNLSLAPDVWNANNAMAQYRITGTTAWQGDWHSAVPVSGSTVHTNWDSCSNGMDLDGSFMKLRGLALLKQYITTVHMWNYVVWLNNASTEIQVAPEDTAGFVVQTKRSLPSCCDQQTISCEIKVTECQALFDGSTTPAGGLPSGYPTLSIFVPHTSIEFKPFDNAIKDETGQANNMKAIIPAPLGEQDASYNLTTTELSSVERGYPVLRYANQLPWMTQNYQKAVFTSKLNAKVAGTYTLTAKFLPFIGMLLYNGKDQIISIRGGTYSAQDGTQVDPEEESVEYKFIDHEQNTIFPNPSEKAYLDSKAAPTRSVNFKLVWKIVVTWKIDDDAIVQTYLYTCNGCRTYYSGALIDGSTISNIVVPASTDTTFTQGDE